MVLLESEMMPVLRARRHRNPDSSGHRSLARFDWLRWPLLIIDASALEVDVFPGPRAGLSSPIDGPNSSDIYVFWVRRRVLAGLLPP